MQYHICRNSQSRRFSPCSRRWPVFVPWPPTELHSLLPRAPSLRVYIFSFISGSAVEMLTTGFLVFTRTFVSLCLSNQPDPCCHIQSHHPLLEKFLQSSCGIPHQGLKDERGKSMCTCTCLKGDAGMWGRRHEEMLTHSNILIAHTHTHTHLKFASGWHHCCPAWLLPQHLAICIPKSPTVDQEWHHHSPRAGKQRTQVDWRFGSRWRLVTKSVLTNAAHIYIQVPSTFKCGSHVWVRYDSPGPHN